MKRHMKILFKIILSALPLLLLAGTHHVYAKDIIVPRDYDKIQDAIDAAKAGDTVRVQAGLYTEIITMQNGVDLIGEGAEVTTIVALAEGPPAAVITTANNCLLDGFTITGARGRPGHAIYLKDVSPTISNCIVRDNDYAGIGVHNSKSSPLIQNNRVHNNGGPGIANNYGASATIVGNEIFANERAGIGNVGSATIIKGNKIYGNGLAGVGTISCSGLRMEGNDIYNNSGVEVSVLSVKGATIEVDTVMENNTIAGAGGPPTIICENTAPRINRNIVTNRGATGIMVIAASPQIINNNISTDGPAGIYVKAGASPIIERNTILGGGRRGIVGDTSAAIINDNNILETGLTQPPERGMPTQGDGAPSGAPGRGGDGQEEEGWF